MCIKVPARTNGIFLLRNPKWQYNQLNSTFLRIPGNIHRLFLAFTTGIAQCEYRSGTVNSKSFVGKVLLQIKWKFELTYAL